MSCPLTDFNPLEFLMGYEDDQPIHKVPRDSYNMTTQNGVDNIYNHGGETERALKPAKGSFARKSMTKAKIQLQNLHPI